MPSRGSAHGPLVRGSGRRGHIPACSHTAAQSPLARRSRSRRPWRWQTRHYLVDLCGSSPPMIRCAGGCSSVAARSSSSGLRRLASTAGIACLSRIGERPAIASVERRSKPAHVDLHGVVGRILSRRQHAVAVVVERRAPVGSRAPPPRSRALPSRVPRSSSPDRSVRVRRRAQGEQQLQAQPRGRVGARSERLARVDHDLYRFRRPGASLGLSHGGRTRSALTALGSGRVDRDRAGESLASALPSRRLSRWSRSRPARSPAAACRSGSTGNSPGAP